MPRRYSNPRKESRALGAVQIIVGLFHFALGILCSQLFLEDGNAGIGSLPVLIVLTYAFCSTPFEKHYLGDHQQEWVFTSACFYPQFITSGSVSVETQRKPTHHKLIAAIVMNIISTCLATLGTISLSIFSITYESIADDYDWSHLAGSMLLQFLLFSAITELVITNIVIDWFVTAVTQVPNDEEGLSLSNYSGSS
ncbi:membrane-spanning 4-domains subfamily A member 12-like [Rousettus aegyptiacus]|uniref:membrane-spanning 4-domains subfamily A member 12-like n=1 Tax=Rousettus aegyptiacus TaxID=9407 RepID=UPI00168CF240|nr:membrane-spanning 4-domains subfamily A member 12-like [Rousettus aegyptiacus]